MFGSSWKKAICLAVAALRDAQEPIETCCYV